MEEKQMNRHDAKNAKANDRHQPADAGRSPLVLSRLSRAFALSVRLLQALIGGAIGKEFGMSTHGSDPALFQDDDAVSNLQRVQAVRNDEVRSEEHEFLHGPMDQGFAFGIRGAGEFVEDEDAWIAQ